MQKLGVKVAFFYIYDSGLVFEFLLRFMQFISFVDIFGTCSSERVEDLDVEKSSTETRIPKSVCFNL